MKISGVYEKIKNNPEYYKILSNSFSPAYNKFE